MYRYNVFETLSSYLALRRTNWITYHRCRHCRHPDIYTQDPPPEISPPLPRGRNLMVSPP
ncbi:hypothetical protein BGX38DRAFT_1192719 [Terfezia claveryi]|nr:hypothetical protein BGX38DRAFT_1192719 [Terfezia claveryi]